MALAERRINPDNPDIDTSGRIVVRHLNPSNEDMVELRRLAINYTTGRKATEEELKAVQDNPQTALTGENGDTINVYRMNFDTGYSEHFSRVLGDVIREYRLDYSQKTGVLLERYGEIPNNHYATTGGIKP